MTGRRAVFAGASSLLIHCAQAFLDAGHKIVGVVTSDPTIGEWAAANGICVVPDGEEQLFSSTTEFDFLFSIGGEPASHQAMAARACAKALRFIDAPCPGKATRHGPSWALIAQQASYGVCWHDMHCSAGHEVVAIQTFFDIAGDDTAWSLHAKCYEAGLSSFVKLVADISRGSLALPKLSTVEAATDALQLPPRLGTLDFSRPAKELVCLVSALDFGPEPNPLGLAKIYLNDTFAVVRHARQLSEQSSKAPGTVLRAEGDVLEVATGDGDVLLTGCASATGGSLEGVVAPGMVLRGPATELLDQLDRRVHSLAQGAEFWNTAYGGLAPVEFPYPRRPAESPRFSRKTVRLSLASTARPAELAAALCAWLSALTARPEVSIMYRDPALAEQAAMLECWLCAWVPITLSTSPDTTTGQATAQASARIDEMRRAGPCIRDLPLRANLAPDVLDRVMRVGVAVGGPNQALPDGMDLMLACDADAPGVVLVADMEMFVPSVLQSMQSNFAAFLAHFAIGGRIGALPLTTGEDAATTDAVNSTAASREKASSVEELITAQTRRTPEREAVCFEGSTLTYRELDDRAASLAARLRLRGVGPGHIVGLCLGRGIELVVGLLGIAKTGAAHLPLDPDYPRDRLVFMMEDSQTALVLTSQALASALDMPPGKTFLFDAPESPDAAWLQTVAASTPATEMAYLMYTSGSTGKPKGVMVTQHNLLNLFAELDAMMAGEPAGRWLAIGSVCFDISVPELWWTLTRGFTVVIHQRTEYQWSVAQALVENEITHFFCTPSMASMLVSDAEGRAALSRLSVLMVGGEALPLQLCKELCTIVSGRVFNIYGPTETTVFATSCVLSASMEFVPLGRPIANTTLSVRTAWGDECPAWVPGELLIGGQGVSNGYWGRAELTADRFIDHPAWPGQKCYRTGDLVRRHPDGALEFLGRIDHQVKIRGHRIELGEIESVILQLPAVKETVVLADKDKFGDSRLVAYVVPKPGETLSSEHIHNAVARKLPTIMNPKIVMVLRAFALTPNGKVDRGALPLPKLTPSKNAEHAMFTCPLERQIAAVWEELLGLKPINATDNFFELGASFYLGIKAGRLLLESTGQLVRLADLVRFPTAERLSQHLTLIADGLHGHTSSNGELAIDSGAPKLPALSVTAKAATFALTSVEAVVAAIWRDVFDIETIENNDDFFSLGGNSLAAIRMFAQLRKHFPVELPLSTLFEASSLSGFSKIVEMSSNLEGQEEKSASPADGIPEKNAFVQRPWSPLVQICRGNGQRLPLFCVHGAGGNVFNFKAISQKLGADQPVYGLHPQGVDGHRPVLGSIESMAEQYVEAIRSAEPHGPYQLLGYSAGGVIAFEMAQQLRKSGQRIALLAMIDTLTPAAATSNLSALRKLWLMRKWSLSFAMQKFRERHAGTAQESSHALCLEKLTRGEWLTPELVEPYLFHHIVTVQASYRPMPYLGPMVLYKAQDATTQYLNATKCLGWEAHVDGQIKLTGIPGSHNSMMEEPGLTVLSMALKTELDWLHAKAESSVSPAATDAVFDTPRTDRDATALGVRLSPLP